MNNGPHKTFEIGMAASGRLFSSYFSLRNVAARRPVSGFEIGVRSWPEGNGYAPHSGNVGATRARPREAAGRLAGRTARSAPHPAYLANGFAV